MGYETIYVICKNLEYIIFKSETQDKIIIDIYWVLDYVSISKLSTSHIPSLLIVPRVL